MTLNSHNVIKEWLTAKTKNLGLKFVLLQNDEKYRFAISIYINDALQPRSIIFVNNGSFEYWHQQHQYARVMPSCHIADPKFFDWFEEHLKIDADGNSEEHL